MNSERLRALALTSVLSSVVVACGSRPPPPPSAPSPFFQRLMPTFDGETLSLNHFDSGQGGGHRMVVKFFSSSCDGCKATLPALQRIYEGSSSIVVVGVCEDESASRARQFVNGLGLSFPVVHDPKGSVARLYEVNGKSPTFVITPRGRVSWVGGDDQTEDVLRSALDAADD